MNKIELIEKFLDSKGLIWVDSKIVTTNGLKTATEYDFKDYSTTVQIPVKLKNGPANFQTDIVIAVDILSFISYGIAFDTPSCFAVSDEFRDILDENNLSREWQDFCLKNKGLVYKITVDKYIAEQRRIASDNCHKKTIEHINAIKRETETKNKINNVLDKLEEDINNRYENINC